MPAKHKKKRSSSVKKTSGRASAKKNENEKEQDSYEYSQAKAIVLFAVAVLLLFVEFISAKEAALWNALHRFVLGCFGVCAFLLPIAIGYVAVTMALGKDRATVKRHIMLSGLFVLIVQSLLEVITASTVGVSFGNAVSTAYRHGAGLFDAVYINGGAIGSLVGFPMEALLSDIGAKITLILLTIVLIMLITRATLMSLWRPIQKTAEMTKERVIKTKERLADAVDEAEKEENETPKEVIVPASKIDIDLGEGYVEVPPVKRNPKRVFEEAVEEIATEQERPQIRIDDLIERASKSAVAEVEPQPGNEESLPWQENEVAEMTAEELQAAEEEVAKEVEEHAVAPVYVFPPTTLLNPPKASDDRTAREEMQMNAELLLQTLKEFGISARVVDIVRGPSVTRYELQPNAGVKISKITGLADDIALRLATSGVRIEAPIPNKAAIGIEVPNKVRDNVSLRELIESPDFTSQDNPLAVALGRDITGQIVTADLAKMPHLLVAGTTGSGKSVCTNSMIQSILFHSSPEDVRMILIDPKVVEFSIYNGIPHLLVPVVTNPRKAAGALGWAVTEMDRRYNDFAENNVRDIKSYNKLAATSDTLQKMPYILIVIDELADLMMTSGKEVEDYIVRLAQKARAAGMHLVIATQRPTVDVVTGLIKSNIPSRIGMKVSSLIDSRTMLDTGGAEKLLGYGDMLFLPTGQSKPTRLQGGFVGDSEVASVVDFLKNSSTVQYDESVVEEINRQAEAAAHAEASADDVAGDEGCDEMLSQAIEVVLETKQASVSLLQRRLRVGYARAGRLVDEMEQRGIIGPHEGSKPRQVLITQQQWIEMKTSSAE